MSITTKRTDVSADEIWSILSDPYTYSHWVVGAKEIRSVSGEWPDPASRLHHTVGAGPAENKGDTIALEAQAPRHLKLLARFRPLGVAEITIDLRDTPSGTEIRMQEDLIGGPTSLVPQKLTDLALTPRNNKTLDRLVDLARRGGR